MNIQLYRHSGVGQNPDKLKLKVVAYCSQAKHVRCLDSSLRWNDGVGMKDLLNSDNGGIHMVLTLIPLLPRL